MKKNLYIVFLLFFIYCNDENKFKYLDCDGVENGNAMDCFGCTDELAINYDNTSTQNDGHCIWSYQMTQNQSFYFIKNILDSTGNQFSIDDFYIGAFNNNTCIGHRKWVGEYTDIPAMGNSGDMNNYLNVGNIPSFRLYNNVEQKEYLLDFDGNCYNSGDHINIINCGFINNGIYYISSLNLVY